MKKILELENDDFRLSVYADGVDVAYARARKVHDKAIDVATSYNVEGEPCEVRIYNPVLGNDNLVVINPNDKLYPVFYENKKYNFDLVFKQKVSGFRVDSKLKGVTEAFHESGDSHVFGSINFGNDIGKSDLVIRYQKDNALKKFIFCFEIFPVKLNYLSDFNAIVRDIDKKYSFLVLHVFRKTYSTFQLSAVKSNDLIWWQIFSGVYNDFIAAVNHVLNRPHARLIDEAIYVKPDRVRRFLPESEERLVQSREAANYYHRINKKVMSVDTPENQFLRYAVEQTLGMYRKLKVFLLKLDTGKDFKNELDHVESELAKISNRPFFKNVSEFKGLRQESLILQKASGYSTVFRCWTMLQQGLGFWNGFQRIEMKSIADLYQMWCFLEIESMLEELLKCKPEKVQLATLETNGLLLQFAKDRRSMVTFKLDNGDTIELYHEYNISVGKNDELVSYTLNQRPDIVLRVTRNDVKDMYTFTYLYDAKYRLEPDVNNMVMDSPPRDAINQMHRYRDAIYYQNKYSNRPEKEVIGAYVLFPGTGSVHDIRNSYYQASIKQVNIGAYPMVPGNPEARKLIYEHLYSILFGDSDVVLKNIRPHKELMYESPNPDVLIGIVSKKAQRKYFRGNPEFYHTGSAKLADVKLDKLKYFCPYIAKRGVSVYYEIKGYKILRRNEIFPMRHALHKGDDSSERLVLFLGKKHIIARGGRLTFPIRTYKYTTLASLISLSQ